MVEYPTREDQKLLDELKRVQLILGMENKLTALLFLILRQMLRRED